MNPTKGHKGAPKKSHSKPPASCKEISKRKRDRKPEKTISLKEPLPTTMYLKIKVPCLIYKATNNSTYEKCAKPSKEGHQNLLLTKPC
jgi:ubiquitin